MVNLTKVGIVGAFALVVSGCASYGRYGSGAGYYGASAGYGYGYGYSRGSPYGYGTPYYGWYEGYYYPGRGSYVYGRDGRRYGWSRSHQTYWQGRGAGHRGGENWSGFGGAGRHYAPPPSRGHGAVIGGGGHVRSGHGVGGGGGGHRAPRGGGHGRRGH